jgi:hypothetical protein
LGGAGRLRHGFNVNAITLGCRRRHHEEGHLRVSDVANAMKITRRHLERIPRRELKGVVTKLDLKLTGEHVEKLARPSMEMCDLARAWGDSFLNDA